MYDEDLDQQPKLGHIYIKQQTDPYDRKKTANINLQISAGNVKKAIHSFFFI